MATNFSSLLQVDASKAEKPKPLPVGTYTCSIISHEFGESNQNKTPYCRVHLQVVAPEGDVDAESFAALGEAATKRKLKFDFWLTDDSFYRFSEFFENTLKMDIKGKTYDELCPAMNGQLVKVEVVHSVSQDGTEIYSNAKRLLAA